LELIRCAVQQVDLTRQQVPHCRGVATVGHEGKPRPGFFLIPEILLRWADGIDFVPITAKILDFPTK
jgi:hypothetical protein